MHDPDPEALDRSPQDEYNRRLVARRDTHRGLTRRYDRLAHLRVAVAVVAIVLAWLTWGAHRIHPLWIAVPVVAFAVLAIAHEGVARAVTRAQRAIAYHEQALARLEHRWMGRGPCDDRSTDPDHPYAAHLDLFGRGSLFDLLCTARTRPGQAALAGWLLSPAPPGVVRARQAAVAELRPALDLREELALVGQQLRLDRGDAALAAWGARPAWPHLGRLRAAVCGIAVLAVLAGAAWALFGAGPIPLMVVLTAEFVVVNLLRQRVHQILLRASGAIDELHVMVRVIRCVQHHPCASPLLQQLQRQLAGDGDSAARQIAALAVRFEALDAARNQLFAPLAAMLLWRTQVALWIEQWRVRWGNCVSPWLVALGQLEALVALSGYAYEHPGDCFPELVDAGPLFTGTQLGHPLLPRDRCVRNDVALGDRCRLLVVSGSNMSGKSTLLRTVGINAVLALAGAPVCAARLRLSPLAIGASLSIHDSLQDGASRFYAEVKQLRCIAQAARVGRPVLFLVDEILHGTNSADRRIGTEAVMQGLLQCGAIGLITTHDLALTEMVERLGGVARNVHFEDQLEAGRMVFDYRLRDGIVRRSNALALMRAVGLIE